MPDDYAPPKPSGKDAAYAVIRGTLSSVPIVGSAAAELFQLVIAPPIEKRRIDWMEAMAAGLFDVQEKQQCILEDLSSNDAFIDTVFCATQAAIRASEKEKLDALRNAVLNSALPNAPDESRQKLFVGWVDSLTVLHLRILRLFSDPPAWYQLHDRKLPEWHIAGSLHRLLTEAYPELASEDDLCDKLCKDLYNEGLLRSKNIKMQDSSANREKHSTELGNQFLRFISAPPE